ncbi:MAG: hypothetical protein ABR929_14900 [Roseiarcus sp.]|jgi:hypothetical protein
MRSGSPDEDWPPSLAPPLPREAADERGAGAGDAAGAFLDHFDEFVMIIGQIDRLPDLAEDLRNWRPRRLLRGAGAGAAFDRYDALAPVARHAFDAVAAGLNTLGSTAVALCDNAGGRLSPDEIVACREIGVVMGRLLERARALIETADDSSLGAARSGVDRSCRREKAG